MSDLEGKILIRLTAQKAGVAAQIESARPLMACRIFEGKNIHAALPLVPMLYSLCGLAQSVAAVRAAESALQTPASTYVEQQRELLIKLESLREHLWRLSIDWLELLALPSMTLTFAPINVAITQLIQSLNADKQLNAIAGAQDCAVHSKQQKDWKLISNQIQKHYLDSDSLLQLNLEDVAQALDETRIEALELVPLPEISNAEYGALLRSGQAESFIGAPQIQAKCFETGPFARQKDHSNLQHIKKEAHSGLYTRYMARVIEAKQLTAQLDAAFAGDLDGDWHTANEGVAQVEAVRGRLVHCVDLDGEQVARYRILAPTEWNFHPEGIAASLLSELKPTSSEQLEQQARMIIHAIDPCVGYELRIEGVPC